MTTQTSLVSTPTNGSKPSYSIAIVTVGSRGDVQPYILLGKALINAGHKVILCTEERLKPLVEEFGLMYGHLDGDSTGLLYEKDAQAALRSGSFMKLIKLTQAWEKKFDKNKILQSYDTGIPKDCDIIVSSALTMTQTMCIAQARKIRWISLVLGKFIEIKK